MRQPRVSTAHAAGATPVDAPLVDSSAATDTPRKRTRSETRDSGIVLEPSARLDAAKSARIQSLKRAHATGRAMTHCAGRVASRDAALDAHARRGGSDSQHASADLTAADLELRLDVARERVVDLEAERREMDREALAAQRELKLLDSTVAQLDAAERELAMLRSEREEYTVC